jgi:hypothetical protein
VFKAMLQAERCAAEQLAYDRPSQKLLPFLGKHFGLSRYVSQPNNYVVFEQYFQNRPPSARRQHESIANRPLTRDRKQRRRHQDASSGAQPSPLNGVSISTANAPSLRGYQPLPQKAGESYAAHNRAATQESEAHFTRYLREQQAATATDRQCLHGRGNTLPSHKVLNPGSARNTQLRNGVHPRSTGNTGRAVHHSTPHRHGGLPFQTSHQWEPGDSSFINTTHSDRTEPRHNNAPNPHAILHNSHAGHRYGGGGGGIDSAVFGNRGARTSIGGGGAMQHSSSRAASISYVSYHLRTLYSCKRAQCR